MVLINSLSLAVWKNHENQSLRSLDTYTHLERHDISRGIGCAARWISAPPPGQMFRRNDS